uniref:NADH-ubiquinone oxidoreductase chain 6 n=1 Tax=Brontispa longissima TaxID=111217 RepID=A0A7T8V7T2_BROLO|nr:NADH dehydrogenase subunit 6 [Brontispa longissima]QQQ89060.1 NADH dehydrogenase subunit 6 [Brontispa longissima]UAJ48108.1 NADH dehydrogenase subunit 6 [Brontispa longissima]
MTLTILTSWMTLNLLMFNHPINMMLTIITQTILISLISSLMMKIQWFSYILFLVMIGGMLIIFMYMTNVASNEKFPKMKNLFFLASIPFALLSLLTLTDKFWMFTEINFKSSNLLELSFKKNSMYSPLSTMMILIMVYLLITMIMVVKLTQTNMGPLRQNN